MYRTYFSSQLTKIPPGEYSFKELLSLYFPELKAKTLYQSLRRNGFIQKKELFRGNIVRFYTIK